MSRELKISDIEPEMDIKLYEVFTGDKAESISEVPECFVDFLMLFTAQSKKYALVKHAIHIRKHSVNRILRDYGMSRTTIQKIREGKL